MLVRDNNLGRVLQTEHDLTDRPMGTQLRNTNGSLIYRTELDYDKQNRLVGFGEEAEGSTYKTTYAYDNDNRVTEIGFGGSDKVKYTYDNLGRVSKRVVEGSGAVTSEYTFVSGGHGSGSTTPLISKISQPSIAFEYAYDNRGNITSEKRGTLTTTYVYDALGQLMRVNDPHENATWVYEYDRGGNITSKKKYAYTTGTLGTVQQSIPYVYGDSTWKDKLTSYNGQTLTYDSIGNLTNDGTCSYTWQAGRQLKKMTNSSVTVEFQYDHNGLRTQKKVTQNSVTTTTNYMLHGKLVTHMTAGSDKLHFFYDAQSRPAKVNFNGSIYTYLHNLQGDIVGIVDNGGNLVVEYKYDAWGKLLATTGTKATTLGKLNPFRYRGYVYDEEVGLYYLRSRYYNSLVGRFVNADTNLGRKGMLFAHSSYTYCLNLLISYADSDGMECRQCIEGVATSYEIFNLDRDQMAIFATWLLGEYPVQSVSQPFQDAVGNLLDIEKDEAISFLSEIGDSKLLKAIPGISLAYDIVKGAVQPFAEYEAKSAAWLKESFGLGAVGSKADRVEITCFFGHWTTEIGVRFYDTRGKLAKAATANVSANHLRKVYNALSTYFPTQHGHPKSNMNLDNLYNSQHCRYVGRRRTRYSSIY